MATETITNNSSNKTARIEFKTFPEQKEFLQYASNLDGKNLTEFLLDIAMEEAKKVVKEHKSLELSISSSKLFAKSLINSTKPNKSLKKAAEEYKKFAK